MIQVGDRVRHIALASHQLGLVLEMREWGGRSGGDLGALILWNTGEAYWHPIVNLLAETSK